MFEQANISAIRRSLWNRVRLQLGGGLLVSALAPFAFRYLVEPDVGRTPSLINSVAGTVIAVVLGYYTFRRVSIYPGVRASYQIVPAFSAAFAFVLVGFLLFRLDYSRFHFVASFLLCLTWFYLVYFQLRKQRRLRFGVVPFGRIDRLTAIDEVDWVELRDVNAAPAFLDGIAADLRADIPVEWERVLSDRALEGMLVVHAKQLEESLTGRIELEHLSENNLGSLIPGILYTKIKRGLDLVATLAALPLLAPVLVLACIAIRLESAGPAIYRQERMGFRGKPFTMYKLRSMHIGTESGFADRDAAITRDNDRRVTRCGRFLRRYRIDELPQVFNILKGEMSWIGPRPEALALSAWYESELPFYRYRHIVRPGITGWAQVKLGHVAQVDQVMEKLHYDFYYIRNFSVWLDILIVASTVRTVIWGFGAK